MVVWLSAVCVVACRTHSTLWLDRHHHRTCRCGKSTLIKLLVGDLEPTTGTAIRNRHCRVEYIAQHQVEQLDLHSTPLKFIASLYPGDGGREHWQNLRNHLASFGLGGDVLPRQRIHTLSGGQKCRLCLACAMYRKPHLLVLGA